MILVLIKNFLNIHSTCFRADINNRLNCCQKETEHVHNIKMFRVGGFDHSKRLRQSNI